MGGRPSKGTKKDRRLKSNKRTIRSAVRGITGKKEKP